MRNSELFELYEGELAFRHRSPRGLHESKRILSHFQGFLGEYPPSPELAKSFLSQFIERKPTTIARYAAVLKVFLKWYGEQLDVKIAVPKTLPSYVEKSDVDKLLEAMRSKKTHKKSALRDVLLVELAVHTGLRRSELASLSIGDIDLNRQVVIVRKGKGAKDRAIPLSDAMTARLADYMEGKPRDDSLFGLAPSTISDKIKVFARKAGVDIHTHSLRDYFATSLSETGATIREIQSLLGHANLTHTERYTLHTDAHLRNAINRLERPVEPIANAVTTPDGKPSGREPDALRHARTQNHQRTLLRLVGRWRDELDPVMWSNPLRDLGEPGNHRGQRDTSLAWQVTSDGGISLCLPLELATEKEIAIVHGYLWQHLESSDLSWLVADPQRGLSAWKKIGGEELAQRSSLLAAIDRACQEVTGQVVLQPATRKVGPLAAFCDTIWAAVTDGVYGDLSYWMETDPESGFHVIKYGAYAVAMAGNHEDAQRYIEWHEELMKRWKSDPLTKEVARLIQARKRMADEMDDVLAKLAVDGHVAGHCDGCP